ncbi:glycosyltransferase [Akkermansiaceae bacterium]|nr:glycosyltransferase [Akkermansiaceae bacterium]MDB4625967.1 glycosyltransferase [Akkermansiaceae bacterium]
MKKKILYIHQQLCVGGVERILINTLHQLSREKYDISLLLLYPGKWDNEVPSHVHLRYAYKKKPSGRFHKYSKIFFPPILRRIPFIHSKFDLAISVHLPTLWYLRVCSCKKIQWVRNDIGVEGFPDAISCRNRRLLYPLVNSHIIRTLKKCDQIVCVAQTAVESFRQRTGLGDKVICRYNVSDEEGIRRKALEPCELDAESDQTELLVVVGRISYQKALHRLIPLAGRLREDGLHFKIVVVGDGPLRGELEAGVRSAGLSDYFLFAGFQNNPYKYMSCAKLIICSSLFEGYCGVTKEAILLHKPFVTTLTSGMREQVADSQAGLIVANNDTSLYPAVRDVLQDEELYTKMSYDSVRRAHELSDNKAIKKLEELIDSHITN